MAEQVTIARPYAEALFRLAQQHHAFAEWSNMLQFMATVAADPQMRNLIGNPKLTAHELEGVFLSVCDKRLDEQGRNLIKVLIENGRLTVLTHIHELYEALKSAYEGEQEASITSAFPLTDAQLKALVATLETRFKRKIKASASVDPELIGGVKIVVGDVVIDGSVAAQLHNMAFALKH